MKYEKLKKDSIYTYSKIDQIDPLHPYRPEYHGTFELEWKVGGENGKSRRMLAYVPEDVRDSTAGLMVLGPDGVSADELLEESGWREIADSEECKEKLIVFFLEAERRSDNPLTDSVGSWCVDETYGKVDGDVAYINEAALTATERFLFCVHESKFYLVGYEAGGTMAHMAVAWNPAFYAGLVTVAAPEVSEKYLKAAGEDYCLNLDGYEDPKHRKGIKKGDIPMPVWIIDDSNVPTEAALNYWKKACGTEKKPRQLRFDQLEFYREAETKYPMNQEKEAYRVCYSNVPGASKNYAKNLQRRIWKDFLYRQRRWMGCPGGELRVTKDPVKDLGMEYHYELFDGWMREWYVYVPESVKEKLAQSKAADKTSNIRFPLVLAMHGYTCSGEIYAGNSGWTKVADKYGFIVIFPSALHGRVVMPENGLDENWTSLAAWNVFEEDDRPDELRFFEHMLDQTMVNYPIDKSAVFATGHSWGSLMTEMLALGLTDRFTAVAPCSGAFFGGSYERMTQNPKLNPYNGKELPLWMFWGTEEEWLIPAEPTHDNESGKTLEMWLKKNHKEEQIPEAWSECKGNVCGRFIDHEFVKEGTADVRFTQVDYMPHATMPEMSFRIWEEFFAQYVTVK